MVTRRELLERATIVSLATVAFPSGAAKRVEEAGMTEEEQRNAAVITRQHDLIARAEVDEAAAQFSDPTRNHGRDVPRRIIRAILADNASTFSDFSVPIEALVASGSTVIARCHFRGKHTGVGRLPINGGLMVGVAPTGRAMDVQHIHWYVLKDGLIAEHWANRDDVGMLQQLGLLPPSPPFQPPP